MTLSLIFLALSLSLYLIVARGYVFSVFWSWFVVPLAPHHIPEISPVWAIGLFLTATFMTTPYTMKYDDKTPILSLLLSLLSPWLTLLIGYFIKVFL